MSGKCSCRYGTSMKARGRLSWPMSTTCCCIAARISCQKRPIWTDWKPDQHLFLFFFPYGGKWGESGRPLQLGCSYSGGSVYTCLLYCRLRVFVWWYGVCVLTLVSSTYVWCTFNSYGANGRLSPLFSPIFFIFPGSDMCERARVYVCAWACTSVSVLYWCVLVYTGCLQGMRKV